LQVAVFKLCRHQMAGFGEEIPDNELIQFFRTQQLANKAQKAINNNMLLLFDFESVTITTKFIQMIGFVYPQKGFVFKNIPKIMLLLSARTRQIIE